MQCQPEAYITIAEEVQRVALANGYKAWIGIPEFVFDAPEPILVGQYVESAFAELKSKYEFPGDSYYLASHSLGGVISQMYAKGRTDIKGLILTGSVLLKNTRNITNDGSTLFDFNVPTLTLNGEIDGLLRITRGAESYYHQKINIHDSQVDKYPVIALEGMSHVSFMDHTMVPSAVQTDDINPDADEQKGFHAAATAIVAFVGKQEGNDTVA